MLVPLMRAWVHSDHGVSVVNVTSSLIIPLNVSASNDVHLLIVCLKQANTLNLTCIFNADV